MKPEPSTSRGASAWGDAAPITPAGETLRVVGGSEIAMGGPVQCDYLFADGSLLRFCGSSTGFTPDGHYFIAPMPSRSRWGLLLFDTREHIVYRCDTEVFWEIDHVDNTHVTGRTSPLVNNASTTMQIDELLAHAVAEPMVNVADLRIPESDWQSLRRYAHAIDLPEPPANAPLVTAEPYLPQSLAALQNPLAPLFKLRFEIVVEGKPSGILLAQEHPQLAWREDGQAFACHAATTEENAPSRYFLWHRHQGWHELHNTPQPANVEPPTRRTGTLALSTTTLNVESVLPAPGLSLGSSGRFYEFLYQVITNGHGETLRPQVIYENMPLDSGPACFESLPLADNRRLMWHVLRTEKEFSRTVCHCALKSAQGQAHTVPGEWLLDHRISPDGRFVALIANEPSFAIPHRIAILESETGDLRWSGESYPDPWLLEFHADGLHLVYLEDTSTQSRDLLRRRAGSGLHYRHVTLSLPLQD